VPHWIPSVLFDFEVPWDRPTRAVSRGGKAAPQNAAWAGLHTSLRR
jgi:hypothetical protein